MIETPSHDESVDKFTSYHRVSDIRLRWNGKMEQFTFQYNPNHDGKADIKDVIDCLLLDMSSYEDYQDDEAGFLYEFGYTENAQTLRDGMKAYRACRENARKIHRLFSDDELLELQGLIADSDNN